MAEREKRGKDSTASIHSFDLSKYTVIKADVFSDVKSVKSTHVKKAAKKKTK